MDKEICYIILGKRNSWLAYFTHGRLVKKITGESASVEFDWQWSLNREEKKGDILGFWHTHPDGSLKPSTRDRKTMQAWVNCFGKSLLCVIQNASRETAYLVFSVKHKEWKSIWVKRPFAYKIFKRFGVYT
ncbi:unnamed protein product [marine sediment metagenome]|uniref:JAB domain-containing protein n=1 Tax=marine sediment metagenome TaxID=412755 RepID=X1G287_9ZZZZ